MNGPPVALVPAWVASDLSGATVEQIQAWVAEGSVYFFSIRNNVYVSLDDVMSHAAGGGNHP